MFKTALILILSFFTYHSIFAGTFKGRVQDPSGKPVQDVYIFVKETPFYTISKENGTFTIKDIPSGTYNILIRHVSYKEFLLQQIKIPDHSAVEKTVTLQPLMHELGETLITAARFTDPASKSPASQTTILPAAIREREAKTSAEVLREENGIMVQKTNHGGGSAVIRGLSSNRILILADGIRLNNAVYRLGNHQYLTTVNVSSLQRMEITKGPGSALFGSDALGGTINLVTMDTNNFSEDAFFHFSGFSRYAGADDEKSLAGSLNYNSKKLLVKTAFNLKSAGDLKRGSLNSFDHLQRTAGQVQSPSGFNSYDFLLGLAYKLHSSGSLIFSHQRSRQFDVPRYDKYEINNYYIWDYQPQKRDLIFLRHEWKPARGYVDRLQTTISLHRQAEGRRMQPSRPALRTEEFDEVWSRGLQISALSVFDHSKISCGFDFYSDRVHSGRFISGSGTERIKQQTARYPDGSLYYSSGLYLMYSKELGRNLTMSGALRYSSNTAKFESADSTFSSFALKFSSVTADGGLVYDWNPDWKIKAGISQGFRAPNLSDLSKFGQSKGNIYEVPNTNLQPEKIICFESGAEYSAKNFSSSLILFCSRIYDMLESRPAEYQGSRTIERQGQIFEVKSKQNFGTADIRGAETEASASLSSSLQIRGQFTYIFGQNTKSDEPVSKIPPPFGLISLKWQKKKYRAELFSRFALKQDRLSDDDMDDPRIQEGGTPGWITLNLRSSVKLNEYINLRFSVENLLDLNYREHSSGINAPGRNFIISAGFEM